jgi:hypothetical protein
MTFNGKGMPEEARIRIVFFQQLKRLSPPGDKRTMKWNVGN